MSRLARVGIAACAAAALALPLQAQATTTQHTPGTVATTTRTPSTTAQTGFVTVATSATQPYLLGSDAAGSVYATVDGALVRYATDGTSTPVALPGTGAFSAAATLGALYVVQGGHVYRLDGSTWTDLALPGTLDGWTVTSVRFPATDRAGEVWVVVTMSRPSATTAGVTEYQSTVAHFDGTGWSTLPAYIGTAEGVPSTTGLRVVDGAPVVSTFLAVHYGQTSVSAWTGSEWTGLAGTASSGPLVTVVRSVQDVLAWTVPFSPYAPTSDVSLCRHTVDGVTSDCFAPLTPVVAAVRLADGRTVVATRASRTNPEAGEGAFYLLSADGLTATALPGSTFGATSVQLLAEPTGSGVWAVTPDGAGAFLVQRAEVAATTTTPGKRPKKPRRTLTTQALTVS